MRQSCNNQPPPVANALSVPCPLCLRGGGGGDRVFSEQARLAFGEQLASVHLSCHERSLTRLRTLTPEPLRWLALLRAGDDVK